MNDSSFSINNYAGYGPRNYERPESRIHEDVCEVLTENPYLDARDIIVSVRDGVVFLTGTVESRRSKKMAEQAIENILGVKDVQNQLQILPSHHIGDMAESLTGKVEPNDKGMIQNRTGMI
jgi:osmotically-inducible protein OsmY